MYETEQGDRCFRGRPSEYDDHTHEGVRLRGRRSSDLLEVWVNGLALCAGVGGLELGLHLAIPGYRCVGYIERDAFAAATLVARMEDQTLDPAPIWDDLTTFDGRAWRDVVDIISAGFPCQPFSAAGKQRGIEDERWIWPDIARIIGHVDPGIVFLENVPGLVRHGLRFVWSDLRRLGFRVRAGFFSAAEVGAPHRRQRLFVLAHREGGGCRRDAGGNSSGRMAHTNSAIRDESGWSRRPLWPHPPQSTEPWPPGLEPALRRVADGATDRKDRLRALGNGVVPLVAAHAFRTLALGG